MDILLVLGKILSIFAIIFMGAFGYKRKWFPAESEKYFLALMMNVSTPFLIIYSVQAQNHTAALNAKALQVFILMTAAILFTCILSVALIKLLKAPLNDRGVYRLALAFTNNGFMGYPLALAVFGNDGLFLAIIANISFNILLFSAGPFLLIYDRNAAEKTAFNIRNFLSIPLVSSVIGLFLYVFDIKFPLVVADTCKIVGEMTIPLAMIIIGIQLSQSSVQRILTNSRLIAVIVLKLIVVPIVLFAVFFKAPVDPLVFCVVLFGMSLPTAAFVSVLSSLYKGNSLLAAECIFTTTLFSLITIPIFASLLNYYLLWKGYY